MLHWYQEKKVHHLGVLQQVWNYIYVQQMVAGDCMQLFAEFKAFSPPLQLLQSTDKCVWHEQC